MKQLLLTLALFLCLTGLPMTARADCPSWTTFQSTGWSCGDFGQGYNCWIQGVCLDPDGNPDYLGDPWDGIADLFIADYGYSPDVDEIKWFYYIIC